MCVSGCSQVCGISIWSPRLDANGNSVRGVAVASELGKHLAIHNFEVFSLSRKKIDLTMQKMQPNALKLAMFCSPPPRATHRRC